ncbi:hypothetical protein AMTRI_Chr10g8370 [Amborella trichopoda]
MLSVQNPPDPSCSSEVSKRGNNDRASEKFALQASDLDGSKLHGLEQPHFSIREYVLAARNRDIGTNWPFSPQYLQLCVKHGVRNLLPPFESPDIVRDPSFRKAVIFDDFGSKDVDHTNGELVNSKSTSSLQIDEPSLAGKEIKDSYLASPSEEEIRSTITSDDQVLERNLKGKEFDLHLANESTRVDEPSIVEVRQPQSFSKAELGEQTENKTSSSSNKEQILENKPEISCTEDLISNLSTVSDPMASKVCPVCKTFTSTSNTTLNAHMDQCLAVESITNNLEQKLPKYKVKPRKKRLMVDIYVTAQHCTLEDLDRRNGSNWATDPSLVPLSGQDCREASNERPSNEINHVKDSCSKEVYVDSNGIKLRILSKFNGDLGLKDEMELKKQTGGHNGSISSLIGKKRRFAPGNSKHLKLKPQCKKLSSFKSLEGEILGSKEVKCRVDHDEGETKSRSLEDGLNQVRAPKSETLRKWVRSKRSNISKHCNNKSGRVNLHYSKPTELIKGDPSAEANTSRANGCMMQLAKASGNYAASPRSKRVEIQFHTERKDDSVKASPKLSERLCFPSEAKKAQTFRKKILLKELDIPKKSKRHCLDQAFTPRKSQKLVSRMDSINKAKKYSSTRDISASISISHRERRVTDERDDSQNVSWTKPVDLMNGSIHGSRDPHYQNLSESHESSIVEQVESGDKCQSSEPHSIRSCGGHSVEEFTNNLHCGDSQKSVTENSNGIHTVKLHEKFVPKRLSHLNPLLPLSHAQPEIFCGMNLQTESSVLRFYKDQGAYCSDKYSDGIVSPGTQRACVENADAHFERYSSLQMGSGAILSPLHEPGSSLQGSPDVGSGTIPCSSQKPGLSSPTSGDISFEKGVQEGSSPPKDITIEKRIHEGSSSSSFKVHNLVAPLYFDQGHDNGYNGGATRSSLFSVSAVSLQNTERELDDRPWPEETVSRDTPSICRNPQFSGPWCRSNGYERTSFASSEEMNKMSNLAKESTKTIPPCCGPRSHWIGGKSMEHNSNFGPHNHQSLSDHRASTQAEFVVPDVDMDSGLFSMKGKEMLSNTISRHPMCDNELASSSSSNGPVQPHAQPNTNPNSILRLMGKTLTVPNEAQSASNESSDVKYLRLLGLSNGGSTDPYALNHQVPDPPPLIAPYFCDSLSKPQAGLPKSLRKPSDSSLNQAQYNNQSCLHARDFSGVNLHAGSRGTPYYGKTLAKQPIEKPGSMREVIVIDDSPEPNAGSRMVFMDNSGFSGKPKPSSCLRLGKSSGFTHQNGFTYRDPASDITSHSSNPTKRGGNLEVPRSFLRQSSFGLPLVSKDHMNPGVHYARGLR